MLRYYPSVPGYNYPGRFYPRDAPPINFVSRLARLGLRLRDDGSLLVVVGPDTVEEQTWWPALERRIAHWAPWLADSAALLQEVREAGTPDEIRTLLRSLAGPFVRLAWEVVGGRQEFEVLLAGEFQGTDLVVACIAAGQVKVLLEAIAEESCDDEGDDELEAVALVVCLEAVNDFAGGAWE